MRKDDILLTARAYRSFSARGQGSLRDRFFRHKALFGNRIPLSIGLPEWSAVYEIPTPEAGAEVPQQFCKAVVKIVS